MLGVPIADNDLNSPENEESAAFSDDDVEKHERVKQVIEDCKKILITDHEVILGGWPLIDAGDAVSTAHEMDTVLILTKECYYVAEYDDQTDRITKYQRIQLEDLEKIEFGIEPGSHPVTSIKSHFRGSGRFHYAIRLHYLAHGQSGYFHMFKPTDTRFFNNMAIPIRTSEEEMESLKAISESFKVALSVKSLNVPCYEGKLEKRKSKVINAIGTSIGTGRTSRTTHSGGVGRANSHQSTGITRNVSDGNLMSLKNVGSKALTGVSSQFAKFKGRFGRGGNHTAAPPTLSTLPEPAESPSQISLDYDDEDDMDSLHINRKGCISGVSVASSSVFVTDDADNSDQYSECSDFEHDEEESDDRDELQTPMADGPRPIGSGAAESGYQRDANDTLLESCGLLTTSPPLRPEFSSPTGATDDPNRRSVLSDVDDFVLDAMKKASLRQLQRKASESMDVESPGYSSSRSSLTAITPHIQVRFLWQRSY